MGAWGWEGVGRGWGKEEKAKEDGEERSERKDDQTFSFATYLLGKREETRLTLKEDNS